MPMVGICDSCAPHVSQTELNCLWFCSQARAMGESNAPAAVEPQLEVCRSAHQRKDLQKPPKDEADSEYDRHRE